MPAHQQSQHEAIQKVWMLRWKRIQGQRGQCHVSIFIPNVDFIDTHPIESSRCLGTNYDAQGSPLGGFVLQVRRNVDATVEPGLGNAYLLGIVEQRNMWQPDTDGTLEENKTRSAVDKYAFETRVPDISKRPWIAEEVFCCVDWLEDFVQCMVKREIIAEEAYQIAYGLREPKVPIMADPMTGLWENASDQPQEDEKEDTQESEARRCLNVAAIQTMQVPRSQPQQPNPQIHAVITSQRPAIGQSQWHSDRRRYERYNNTASTWEYRDSETRQWVAMA